MIYFNINTLSRFFFVCLFLFTLSCRKKEDPVISKETPVFYFSGSMDGSPLGLNAGENDYYMYSSYIQDANNLYHFIGDLKRSNCSTCGNRFQFRINDFKISSPGASVVIDSSLTTGSYTLQTPASAQSTRTLNFIAMPNLSSGVSVVSYAWDFGDGTKSSVANPTHTYSQNGQYNVQLSIVYSNSCNSSLSRTVHIKGSSIGCTLNIQGQTSITTGSTTTLSAVFGAPCNAATYLWSTGETTSSISVSPTSAMMSYSVVACCSDAGCCDSTKITVFANSGSCYSDFNYYVDTTSISNPYSLSKAVITWTDNAGITYTSNNISQPSTSYFQIVSVENYLTNQNNEPTKKLHVKFKCNVFNNGTSHQIDNGDAVIAVSYK